MATVIRLIPFSFSRLQETKEGNGAITFLPKGLRSVFHSNHKFLRVNKIRRVILIALFLFFVDFDYIVEILAGAAWLTIVSKSFRKFSFKFIMFDKNIASDSSLRFSMGVLIHSSFPHSNCAKFL